MQGLLAVFKPEDEVSPERAAELLGVSRPIVYRRMDSGRLPFRQVGTHRRICPADVAKLKQFEDREGPLRRPCRSTPKISKRTMTKSVKALLDANVLDSNQLRIPLLQLAQNDVLDARWRERIEQEWLSRDGAADARAYRDPHHFPDQDVVCGCTRCRHRRKSA
jgi:excisionase family DNA binding protein